MLNEMHKLQCKVFDIDNKVFLMTALDLEVDSNKPVPTCGNLSKVH